MDKIAFLDSQLWLLRMSTEAMEKLQVDFKFYTLLTNAYCCFHVDKAPVVLTKGKTAPRGPARLHLQVLLSLQEDSERKSESAEKSASGLYFILDGLSYLVNHTLISKISIPEKSNKAAEPPSAILGWQGVEMRWWIRAGSTAEVAIQKLSYAIKTMNRFLLQMVLSHDVITEAKLKRRTNNDTSVLVSKSSNTDLQACPSSSSAYKMSSSAKACASSSSTRDFLCDQLPLGNIYHLAGPQTGDMLEMTGDASALSVSLSHHFTNWMDFTEIVSIILARNVTPGIICDAFFSNSNRNVQKNVPRNVPTTPLGKQIREDSLLCYESSPVPSAFNINESETSALSMSGEKEAKRQKTDLTGYSPCHNDDIIKNVSDVFDSSDVTAHTRAAYHFIAGIMSSDRSEELEAKLLEIRASKEKAIQCLLTDLYSFPLPLPLTSHQHPHAEGLGGVLEGQEERSKRNSTAEDKVSKESDLISRMESLVGEISEISDVLAMLRAMPQSPEL